MQCGERYDMNEESQTEVNKTSWEVWDQLRKWAAVTYMCGNLSAEVHIVFSFESTDIYTFYSDIIIIYKYIFTNIFMDVQRAKRLWMISEHHFTNSWTVQDGVVVCHSDHQRALIFISIYHRISVSMNQRNKQWHLLALITYDSWVLMMHNLFRNNQWTTAVRLNVS